MRRIYEDMLDDMSALNSRALHKVLGDNSDKDMFPSSADYEYMIGFGIGELWQNSCYDEDLLNSYIDSAEYIMTQCRYIEDVSDVHLVAVGADFPKMCPKFVEAKHDDIEKYLVAELSYVICPKVYIGYNANFKNIKQIMKFIKMINRLGKMLDKFSLTFFKRNDASKFEYIIDYDNGMWFNCQAIVDCWDNRNTAEYNKTDKMFSYLYRLLLIYIPEDELIKQLFDVDGFYLFMKDAANKRLSQSWTLYKQVNKELPNPFLPKRGFVFACNKYVGKNYGGSDNWNDYAGYAAFDAHAFFNEGSLHNLNIVDKFVLQQFLESRPKVLKVAHGRTYQANASANAAWCGLLFEPMWVPMYNLHFWIQIFVGVTDDKKPTEYSEEKLLSILDDMFDCASEEEKI